MTFRIIILIDVNMKVIIGRASDCTNRLAHPCMYIDDPGEQNADLQVSIEVHTK